MKLIRGHGPIRLAAAALFVLAGTSSAVIRSSEQFPRDGGGDTTNGQRQRQRLLWGTGVEEEEASVGAITEAAAARPSSSSTTHHRGTTVVKDRTGERWRQRQRRRGLLRGSIKVVKNSAAEAEAAPSYNSGPGDEDGGPSGSGGGGSCSATKKVTMYQFCSFRYHLHAADNDNNHQDGSSSSPYYYYYGLWLGDGFLDPALGIERDRAGCRWHEYPPKTVEAPAPLLVGTIVSSGHGNGGNGGDDNDFGVELLPGEWQDGTFCGGYTIILSLTGGGGSAACWDNSGPDGPQNLSIPRCSHGPIATGNDEDGDGDAASFAWYFLVEPETTTTATPPSSDRDAAMGGNTEEEAPPPDSDSDWNPAYNNNGSSPGNRSSPGNKQSIYDPHTHRTPGSIKTGTLGTNPTDGVGGEQPGVVVVEDEESPVVPGEPAETAEEEPPVVPEPPPTAENRIDWPADWTDEDGDGCDWYAGDPARRCSGLGSGSALEACAVCGGGVVTTKPVVRGDERVDWPADWKDGDGDGCGYYAGDPVVLCSAFGDSHPGDGGMTASEACVVCGGGRPVGDLPPGDAAAAVHDAGLAAKIDWPPGWTDADGDGCGWYATGPLHCRNHGENENDEGITANEACVVCGGGVLDGEHRA